MKRADIEALQLRRLKWMVDYCYNNVPFYHERLGQAGVTSGGVTNYTVELTLDDTDGLRSGMNVWVSIVTGARERCLRVPSEAVSGGVVQVQRGGKTEEVSVKTGISGGGYTEILEGLEEGDVVLLPAS